MDTDDRALIRELRTEVSVLTQEVQSLHNTINTFVKEFRDVEGMTDRVCSRLDKRKDDKVRKRYL